MLELVLHGRPCQGRHPLHTRHHDCSTPVHSLRFCVPMAICFFESRRTTCSTMLHALRRSSQFASKTWQFEVVPLSMTEGCHIDAGQAIIWLQTPHGRVDITIQNAPISSENGDHAAEKVLHRPHRERAFKHLRWQPHLIPLRRIFVVQRVTR